MSTILHSGPLPNKSGSWDFGTWLNENSARLLKWARRFPEGDDLYQKILIAVWSTQKPEYIPLRISNCLKTHFRSLKRTEYRMAGDSGECTNDAVFSSLEDWQRIVKTEDQAKVVCAFALGAENRHQATKIAGLPQSRTQKILNQLKELLT